MAIYLFLPHTVSTNTHLSGLRGDLPAPVICMAATQAAGQGQYGRQWVSDSTLGLYFSVLLDVTVDDVATLDPPLPIRVARCIESVLIEKYGISNLQIKYPNDVLLRGKKLSGILISAHHDKQSDVKKVVIGIGLNINQVSFPGQLAKTAISLRQFNGRCYSKYIMMETIYEAIKDVC